MYKFTSTSSIISPSKTREALLENKLNACHSKSQHIGRNEEKQPIGAVEDGSKCSEGVKNHD
jgi:hypothetical protein